MPFFADHYVFCVVLMVARRYYQNSKSFAVLFLYLDIRSRCACICVWPCRRLYSKDHRNAARHLDICPDNTPGLTTWTSFSFLSYRIRRCLSLLRASSRHILDRQLRTVNDSLDVFFGWPLYAADMRSRLAF